MFRSSPICLTTVVNLSVSLLRRISFEVYTIVERRRLDRSPNVPPPGLSPNSSENNKVIKKLLSHHVILFAFLLSVGACAGSPGKGETPVADNVAGSQDCRTIKSTGSRLGKKVCKNTGQWEIESEQYKEAVERIQRDSAVSSGAGD
jgi:hypothetical protein